MPTLPDLPPDQLAKGDRIATADNSAVIPPVDRIDVEGEGADRQWVVYLGEGQPGPFYFTAEHRLTVERGAAT